MGVSLDLRSQSLGCFLYCFDTSPKSKGSRSQPELGESFANYGPGLTNLPPVISRVTLVVHTNHLHQNGSESNGRPDAGFKKGPNYCKKSQATNLKALGLEQRQAGHHGWKESHPEWPDKIVGAKKINEKSQKSPKIFKNRENAIFTRSIGLIGIHKYIFSHGALPGT